MSYKPVTEKQLKFLDSLEKELGFAFVSEAMDDLALDGTYNSLTAFQASQLISEILDRKKARDELRAGPVIVQKAYKDSSDVEDMETSLERIKKVLKGDENVKSN